MGGKLTDQYDGYRLFLVSTWTNSCSSVSFISSGGYSANGRGKVRPFDLWLRGRVIYGRGSMATRSSSSLCQHF